MFHDFSLCFLIKILRIQGVFYGNRVEMDVYCVSSPKKNLRIRLYVGMSYKSPGFPPFGWEWRWKNPIVLGTGLDSQGSRWQKRLESLNIKKRKYVLWDIWKPAIKYGKQNQQDQGHFCIFCLGFRIPLFAAPHLRTWVLLLQWPFFFALSDVEFYTFDFECRNLTLRKDTFIYQCYNGYLRLTCQTNILRVAQVIQAASQAFSAILADAWGWSALGPLGSMSSRLFTENPTLMPSKLVKL